MILRILFMETQSINNTTINTIPELEFHDALEDFPFFDANNSFQLSNSDNNSDEFTVSVISDQSPESPSSPSSSGLRHRRSPKQSSQSQFFKNNPNGLIDFDPDSTSVITDNKYEKLNDRNQLIDEIETSSSSSLITSNSINTANSASSSNYVQEVLSVLAELVIKVISYQTKFITKSVSFPIFLLRFSYMLVTDPFGIIRLGKSYVFGDVSEIWGICCTVIKLIKLIVAPLIKKNESTWNVCCRILQGVLWLVYCGVVLVGLLVPALLFSGMIVKWVVQEPIQITDQLTFDYTKDTPMAFLPVISCMESSSLENSGLRKIGSFGKSRVIPFDHELQTTVSLTLPESDYNRNLGIFQVRLDFLSSDGKALGSTRQPCMLQFRSQPIRLLSTFVKLAPILTGYASETQTLDIKFSGYTEKNVPTSCIRVVIEQRAEFLKGGGVPEIYSASLKLESQLPFLRRMLWYFKGLIYMWISFMMFLVELLFTLICCTPIIFPRLRRASGSVNNDVSQNTATGRS